jgi:predicted nucleic-acid-binding protein
MPAVDTNVLLRLLLDDDEEQASAARSLQRSHAPLFVSHVVLAETAWVLTSAYGFSRERLGKLVQMLLDADGISLQEPQLVRVALDAFQSSRADFPDCLILAIAESAGMAPLATFDERLGKLSGTRRLGRKRKP